MDKWISKTETGLVLEVRIVVSLVLADLWRTGHEPGLRHGRGLSGENNVLFLHRELFTRLCSLC